MGRVGELSCIDGGLKGIDARRVTAGAGVGLSRIDGSEATAAGDVIEPTGTTGSFEMRPVADVKLSSSDGL